MPEHVAITDPEIHEPKGAAAAASGQVMTANGSGSTSWDYLSFDYGELYTQESDAATLGSIGTTAQTFPFASADVSNGITVSAASNNMTVAKTGIYYVHFSTSFSTVAAGDAGLYEFKISVNGTPSHHEAFRQMSGSSDTGSCGVTGLLSLTANDVLTVRVESDDGGDTDDISIKNASFTAILMRQTA